jgi:hypothetical protein
VWAAIEVNGEVIDAVRRFSAFEGADSSSPDLKRLTAI